MNDPSCQPDDFNLEEATNQAGELAKQVKKETDTGALSKIMGHNLQDKLDFEVANMKISNSCGWIEFVVADYQADFVIACNVIKGRTQLILSTDSDFAGLCSEHCIVMDCHFPASRKKGGYPIPQKSLKMPQRAVLEQALKATGCPVPSTVIEFPYRKEHQFLRIVHQNCKPISWLPLGVISA